MAIPEIDSIDYTTKEYLKFVQHIQAAVTRLNSEKDNNNSEWTPHRWEMPPMDYISIRIISNYVYIY